MTNEEPKKPKKKQSRKSLSLPGITYARAKHACDRLGIPLAAKVQGLVETWLDELEGKGGSPAAEQAEASERPTIVDSGPALTETETKIEYDDDLRGSGGAWDG